MTRVISAIIIAAAILLATGGIEINCTHSGETPVALPQTGR